MKIYDFNYLRDVFHAPEDGMLGVFKFFSYPPPSSTTMPHFLVRVFDNDTRQLLPTTLKEMKPYVYKTNKVCERKTCYFVIMNTVLYFKIFYFFINIMLFIYYKLNNHFIVLVYFNYIFDNPKLKI